MLKTSLICSLAGVWTQMLLLGLTSATFRLNQSCDDQYWASFDTLPQILVSIGTIFGAYIFCFLAEIFGRKFTVIALNLPIILSCALFEFFCHAQYANYARAVSHGGALTILPIYIGEISEKQSRGASITFLYTVYLAGQYFQQILSAMISKNATVSLVNYGSAILCIIISIIFASKAVETPCYYIQRKQFHHARESIMKIRSLSVDIDHELNQLQRKNGDEENITETSMLCLRSYGCVKAFIILSTLIVFQNLAGPYNLHLYHSLSFDSIQYSNIARIIRGIVVGGSSLLCTILVDRIGRIKCLLISFIFILTSLVVFLIFINLNYEYVVFVALVTCWAAFEIGAGPISLVYRGELFPMKYKMILSATATAIEIFPIFSLIYFFHSEANNLFIFLSIMLSFIAVITIKLFYFETKGKSLNEIQLILYKT